MNARSRSPGSVADPERLARLGPPLLGLIVIEFLLGMAVNLFVTVPTGGGASVLGASAVLDAHLVVAVLLIGISANALRLGLRSGRRAAVALTVVGFLGAVGASLAGLAVLGGSGPGASYAMSVGFAALLIEAGYLLRRALPSGAPSERPSAGAAGARMPPGPV